MKKAIWWIVGIILVVVIVITVSRGSNTETGPIKIGVITSLSGELAKYGEGMKNAIEMAINDSGAKDKIQLILEDDHSCTIANDVSAVQKLVNIDKVNSIIGPLCSSAMLSISDVTEKNNIFMMTSGASSKTVTVNRNYVFRTVTSDSAGAKKIADLTIGKGYKNISLLHNVANDAYVQEIADFKDTFEGAGGKIIVDESYVSNATDFRSQLTKIKGSQTDALVVSGFPKEVGTLIKQAKALGIKVPILATGESVGTADLINTAGNDAEGLIFPKAQTPTNKESADFIAAYKKNYGVDPVLYTAESYDAAKILIAGNRSVDDIKAAVYKMGQNYPGASGMINFEKTGDVTKPYTIVIVKDGKFVDVQ